MTVNKLGLLRADNLRGGCPFGLSISTSCKSAGSSIRDMQVLQSLPEEERDAARQANRRIYRQEADGQRCPYLEGVVKAAKEDIVNCDWGDSAAGEHSYPFRGSPVYPRVFNGFQADRNYSTQLGDYSSGESNDYGRGQLSDGVFQAIYSSEEEGSWVVNGKLDDFERITLVAAEGKQPFEEFLKPDDEYNSYIQVFDIFELKGFQISLNRGKASNLWRASIKETGTPSDTGTKVFMSAVRQWMPEELTSKINKTFGDEFSSISTEQVQQLIDVINNYGNEIHEEIKLQEDLIKEDQQKYGFAIRPISLTS